MPRETFYALVSPYTFGTQHRVYVKLKTTRNGEQWTMEPLQTGRTIESARCQPNDLTTVRLTHLRAAKYRQRHLVDKGEAESGVGTYFHAYVCVAPAPRHVWRYGLVFDFSWSEKGGGRLIVKTDEGYLFVSVLDESLHVVTLAAYALRPFNGLPMAPDLDAFKATLKELVARFLNNDRHANLDVSDLPLDCSSWTQPPDATCRLCFFANETVGEMSVGEILDFVHAQYQDDGDVSACEPPAPRDLQRPRSASDEFLVLEPTPKKRIRTTDAPDLMLARASDITLETGALHL